MGFLQRGAGVLVAPRRTFGRMLRAPEGGLGEVLGLMFLLLLATVPLEAAAAALSAERSVLLALNRVVSLFLQFALAPLAASLAAGLLLAAFLRLRAPEAPRVDGVLTAAAYLWLPMGVLGVVGALAEEAGLALPWLPHLPLAAFLASEPSWPSVLLRLVCSYGWSLGLFVVLVRVALRPPVDTAESGRPPRWAAWALAGLLALGEVAGAIHAFQNQDRLRMPGAGDPAPAFELSRADGQGRQALAALRGRPVLIAFWADWCSVCMAHMPELARFASAHPEVSVLAVHRGGEPAAVQALVAEGGFRGPLFLVDGDERVSTAYRVDVLPAFFAVGPDGVIRGVRLGAPEPAWLEQTLRPEVAPAPP